MEINEIKNHNDEIRKQIFDLQLKYAVDLKILQDKLIVPCQQCPYDGEYRCDVCKNMDYAGFNIINFPYDEHVELDIDVDDECDFDNK